MGRGSSTVQGVGGGPSCERRFRAVVRDRARAAWIETDSDPNRCPSFRVQKSKRINVQY